jgi:hypothetical protein
VITLKYFESFLESEKNEFGVGVFNYEKQNPEPKSWNYDKEDNSFNFEFHGEIEAHYTLKVFPQYELFCLFYPKGDFTWCAFSSLTPNRDEFINYERGRLYAWLVKRIIYIDYKLHLEVEDWATLTNSDFGKEE